MPDVIATRTFTHDDVLWFAQASGDWNPIHVDVVKARRTIAGNVVVHGMYSLLWALESHLAADGHAPRRIQAFFRRLVHPGDQLEVRRETGPDETRLALVHNNEEAASILLSGSGRLLAADMPSQRPEKSVALDNSLEDLKQASGHLMLSADTADLDREFPLLTASLGRLPVAAILGFSRLVGMHCPGLHSLFTGLDVTFDEQPNPDLAWTVEKQASPFAPLSMRVRGGGAVGNLSAFLRPAPVQQPAMTQVAESVTAAEFSGHRALVIGGSRGLGELTAKVLAAGGCDVVITYNAGRDDAQNVATEIAAHGGSCCCLHFDTTRPEQLAGLVTGWSPDLLFYFATPKITRQDGNTFNAELHQAFHAIYVQCYEALVSQLVASAPTGLWALYPSTVFAETPPQGFAEYATAKREGEALCHALQHRYPTFHAMIERFPRLATDQTLALIPQKAEPALPVILRAVRELHDHMKASRT